MVVRITDWAPESGLDSTSAVGARVVSGNPQPPGLARVGEAPADDLVEAEVAHRVLGPATQALLAGQAADPAGTAGSVLGRYWSRPWTRPTSSIRSTSRVTRSGDRGAP